MKALYLALKALVESAPAPLFTSFKDDFYKHDADTIEHDLQSGDVFYFAIKQCGTILALADKSDAGMQQFMTPGYANDGRAHYLIRISERYPQGFDIQSYSASDIAKAVGAVHLNPNRVPNRQFAYEALTGLEPHLHGSRLFSDFTATKGKVLYLSLTNNSVSYFQKDGDSRTLGLPFRMDRKTGAFKLVVTSPFGHATLTQIKQGVYQRALKARKAA